MNTICIYSATKKFIQKILLALPLFSLITTKVFSQKLNEDSIKKVIKETKQDTTRILALRKLASYYILHKGEDSAGLALLKQADEEAHKINFQLGICEVLLTQGNYYSRKSDWTNAIAKFKELTVQSQLVKDSFYSRRTKMMAMNNLAGIYSQNGDYTTALDYYMKSRDILETIKADATALCIVYVNIAGMYNILNQPKQAEEYLAKCYPLLDSARPYLRYLYWQERQNLADKNKDAKMVSLTIDSLEKTLKTSSLSEYQQNQYGETLYEMKGNYQSLYQKNYPAAIESFQSMLQYANQIDDKPEIYNAQYEIGNSYYLNGDNLKAISFLEAAYKGAMANNVSEVVSRAAKLLSDIYKQQNKAKAFDYLSVAYQLNDSLKAEKNMEQLNFLEASYQNAKKEKEIAELKIVNTEKQLAVVKRNRLLIIVGITAVGLLFVLSLLYRNSKQKQTIAEKEQKIQEEQIKFLERQQQIVSLQSMINGQETERIRIAKDLHDGLGGVFSTVKMHYSTLQHEVPEIKNNSLYRKTFDLINNASDELRKVAHNMMPEVLMKVGLVEALKDFCNNISSGKLLKISLQTFGMEKRLSTSTEIMLFRIIQELINNIIKHAYAIESIIQFNREGNRLSITIEDNGRGFDTKEAEEKATMGINTVKSRVDYLNGKLTIDSRKDIGTTVMIDLLLNEN
jgi:two-component system NarL family sensor kinase